MLHFCLDITFCLDIIQADHHPAGAMASSPFRSISRFPEKRARLVW
ncbi:MAG: hypothetical protein NC115_08775 [Bacteroidales bacterium]|nr:hypothetical protein [Bacteroidales bacterium]